MAEPIAPSIRVPAGTSPFCVMVYSDIVRPRISSGDSVCTMTWVDVMNDIVPQPMIMSRPHTIHKLWTSESATRPSPVTMPEKNQTFRGARFERSRS